MNDAPFERAPTVHVVDDDGPVRRSLAMLLEAHGYPCQTYAYAGTILDALPLAPGCILLDVCLPGLDGISLLLELRRRGCELPAIVVTGHGDVALAVRAMKAGASDLMEKPYAAPDLLARVGEAIGRHGRLLEATRRAKEAAARMADLTPREREVLDELVEGRPNKVMAQRLGISPRTVEVHRAHLMAKLGCRSVAEAVRLALAAGL